MTISVGTSWQSSIKTANFTAVSGEGYFVDTTSNPITVTLPASPSTGDEVNIIDYAGTANNNNISISSSDNIEGASDDVSITYIKGAVKLVYSDATKGWLCSSAANETSTALVVPPIITDFLVVAGGGGGGQRAGGGGGAGGLITSYGNTSGGGSVAESSLELSKSINYTITVGSGGAYGSNGNVSTISGTGISTIQAIGGGRAGNDGVTNNGATGGSGGGGRGAGGNGTGGSGTLSQGFDGGNAGGGNEDGGGGGGAAAAGTVGQGSSGNGGNGLAVNILNATNAATASIGEISGSDVYYAGGGGGSFYSNYSGGGNGGLGGGADGAKTVAAGDDATANTGGGGGGGYQNSNGSDGRIGGTGGSGLIILRYPSTNTLTAGAGLTQASGSPFTEGSDKVSVFTAGTGTITFS